MNQTTTDRRNIDRFWHKALCSLLTLTLLIQGIIPLTAYAGVVPVASRQHYDEAMTQLEQYMDLVSEMRTHLDKSQFATEARLDSLDYDAGQIIQFAKKQISFEQYAGSLRGALGTLRSAAGNALDQSLLLATLLNDAGYEARIVHGKITQAQAEALLYQKRPQQPARPAIVDKDAYDGALRKMWGITNGKNNDFDSYGKQSQQTGSSILSDATKAVGQDYAFISSTLKTKNIKLGDSSSYPALVEEAREYFWVEYIEGASGEWKPVHVAFEGVDFDAVTIPVTETFVNEIPTQYQHRLRIEVLIEQRLGGKIKTSSLIPAWEAPAANLSGRSLTFTCVPLSMLGQLDKRTIEIPEEGNDVFLPVFLGSAASNTFDLLGNVISSDAAGSAYAAIFATEAEKMSSALSSLNALGSKSNAIQAVALNALKLKFTFIEPGGKETTYWRQVYQRDSGKTPGGREDLVNTYQALTQVYTFMVRTESWNDAAVLDASYKALLDKQSQIQDSLSVASAIDQPGAKSGSGTVDTGWTGAAMLYGLFDKGNGYLGVKTYRHLPSLVIHRRSLPLSEEFSVHMDVVQNQRRLSNPKLNGTPEGVEMLINMGAWESYAEGLLIAPGVRGRNNTHTAFKQFRNVTDRFHVISDVNDKMLQGPGNEEPQITNIRRELDRGYVVILPDASKLDSPDAMYWWRVDPRSGVTLGIGASGEGSEDFTYAYFLQRVVVGAVMTGGTTLGCFLIGGAINAHDPGRFTAGDCIGIGLGVGLGAASGATVAAGIASWGGAALAFVAISKLTDVWGGLE